MINGYYYLHTNGSLIYKLGTEIVSDIRDSTFAIGLWPIDTADRETAWNLLVEAMAAGAELSRIEELAKLWKCDDRDALNYANRVGCILGIDGNKKTATRKDFINLQESPCGFGDTYLEAMSHLASQLGYVPSKIWGMSFKNLLEEI